MNKILVSGLINVETSVNVNSFPIEYSPIEYPFNGVHSCVSGVGYNVSLALKTLGSDVDLISIIGDDNNGRVILDELNRKSIDSKGIVIDKNNQTAQSVVLVNGIGKRKIYCDLKNLQDKNSIPLDNIDIKDYDIAVITNINFNRELLRIVKNNKILIASDVHVLSSIDDSYNQDFLSFADILFLSNEAIFDKESAFLQEIYQKYHNKIIVCGCGEQGALIYVGEDDKYYFEEAKAPYGVKSTVGAGDALFSAFIHFYHKGEPIELCLKKAVLFAGIKISQQGGSNGFVNEDEINNLLK